MKTVAVIILVLVVLAVLAGLAFAVLRTRRRATLQRRFGPEYDRVLEDAGNRREAEQHLASVARRRDDLDIRDLDEQERSNFEREWEAIQAKFVDEPARAVDAAEVLVTTVMRERGYPTDDDFRERSELVAVDHPNVVQHYRDAHDAHERHRAMGAADTEELREAFVHYRALFMTLVGRDVPVPSETTSADDASRAEASRAEASRADTTPPDEATAVSSESGDRVDLRDEARSDARIDADQPEPHYQEGRR